MEVINNWFNERKSKYASIISQIIKKYDPEDFKKFEATLVARSKEKCLINLDRAINFDYVFQEIDQYFNDDNYQMKGFVGDLLEISESFREKFVQHYPSYIIDESIELKNPYYEEKQFTQDIAELFRFNNELFDKKVENDFDVYKLYQHCLQSLLNVKMMIEFMHLKQEVDEFEKEHQEIKFTDHITSPYFIHQTKLFSMNVIPDELKLYTILESEYEQLKIYIEKNYENKDGLSSLSNIVRMKLEKLNQINKK